MEVEPHLLWVVENVFVVLLFLLSLPLCVLVMCWLAGSCWWPFRLDLLARNLGLDH